jgi:transcriptional regulator with XRE-family HTH domain
MRLTSDTVGRRLAAIRRDRGLTQAELGDLVGKSKQTISALEHGRHGITLADAMKCAEALGCHLRDLCAPLDKPLPRRPSLWLRVQRRRQQVSVGIGSHLNVANKLKQIRKADAASSRGSPT